LIDAYHAIYDAIDAAAGNDDIVWSGFEAIRHLCDVMREKGVEVPRRFAGEGRPKADAMNTVEAGLVQLGEAARAASTAFQFGDDTVSPTEVGQRVRLTSWAKGTDVKSYMVGMTGVVVRFTRAGNPVIRFDEPNYNNPAAAEVTDTYGCARRVDDNDRLVRPVMTECCAGRIRRGDRCDACGKVA